MNQRYASWIVLIGLIGCSSEQLVQTPTPAPTPNYARPLPEGRSALRLVTDPARLPNLAEACRGADDLLIEAIDQSLTWLAAPSSRKFFPFEGVTHRRARASLVAMRDLVAAGLPPDHCRAELLRQFDIYESVGYDGSGTVLYTGYYAPVFAARRTPTGDFRFPLYKRPADLATDPVTGEPQGRRLDDGSIVPYATRREIEELGMLAGSELVWLDDPLSVYIAHVNGSAKLRIAAPGTDPEVMHVGYAGKTDWPYKGLGQSMVEAGLLGPDELSLASVKRAYRRDPQRVIDLIHDNESYVFFAEYDGAKWPAGSLGVRVTPKRTLATDKKVYPRGGLVLVNTRAASFAGPRREFLQFMLDQDTGGAIQAPGRADIFMGIGPGAEILAGGQYAEGRLHYLFLKRQYVRDY